MGDMSSMGDNFVLEDIPPKMILIDVNAHDDISLIVYHAGKINTIFIFLYIEA